LQSRECNHVQFCWHPDKATAFPFKLGALAVVRSLFIQQEKKAGQTSQCLVIAGASLDVAEGL